MKVVSDADLMKEVVQKKMKKQYKFKGQKKSGLVIKKVDFIDICNARSTLSLKTIAVVGPVLSLTER